MKKVFIFLCLFIFSSNLLGYEIFEDISLTRLDEFLKYHPNARVIFKDGLKIPSLISNVSIPVDGENGVRDFLVRNIKLFGVLPEKTTLSLVRSNFFEEYSIYRYSQVFEGVEVEGGEVVVLLKGGNIIQISNALKQIDNPSNSFNYTPEAAKSIVLNHLKPSLYNEKNLEVKRSFMGLGDGFYPVYKVFIQSYVPIADFIYYIDARDGSVIQRVNRIYNASANVYMDSPEKDGTTTTVQLVNLTSSYYLQGSYVDVFSNCDPRYACSNRNRQAKSDNNGNFLYNPAEPSTTDPFAEVMCYYHINRAHNWYKSKGINALDFKLEAAVNVISLGDEMQCNAAYMGGSFIVGLCLGTNPYNSSKKTINISYDVDVMMHEYTHGFVDRTSGLYGGLDSYGLNGMPNGINEGVADFIPSHITDDEIIGRHLAVAMGGGAVRNLNDYASCPEYIVGESHEDGKVFASPTWLARKYLNGDDNFGKAVALAIASLNSSASFQEAANAVISISQNIGGSAMVEQVRKAYEERNLLKCGRLVDVPNGYNASGWTLMPEYSGVNGKQPFVIQFVYTVPSNAQSISVDMGAINLQNGGDATGRVTFYVNYNSYVRYSTSGTTATYKWVNTPSQSISNPRPGKYYVLAVGDGYGLYQFSFTFTYKGPPPTVASITPNSAKQGETIPEIVVKGTNFQQGARITLGPNTNVQTTLFVDSNTLKGQNVRISLSAAPGKRNVTVTNPDGQQGTGTGLFTISPADPSDVGVDTGYDTGKDIGYDAGKTDTYIPPDSGSSDILIRDVVSDVHSGYDAGKTDTYISPDSGSSDILIRDVVPDVQSRDSIHLDKGYIEECSCDETTICDPDCECDPECQGSEEVSPGCSCSLIE